MATWLRNPIARNEMTAGKRQEHFEFAKGEGLRNNKNQGCGTQLLSDGH